MEIQLTFFVRSSFQKYFRENLSLAQDLIAPNVRRFMIHNSSLQRRAKVQAERDLRLDLLLTFFCVVCFTSRCNARSRMVS
jgi:hypothetical protein